MKEVKNGMLKILERTVRLEVDKNKKSDPPICPLILHQPKSVKK